jgi:C-terminal processing protease CtpA/Prc
MKQSFRVSLGAVVLALATLAAVIFAILNFDQRARFESPDDGVAWRDTDHGIEAWKVTPGGPAWQAGIRQGDRLVEIGGQAMPAAVQGDQAGVARRAMEPAALQSGAGRRGF